MSLFLRQLCMPISTRMPIFLIMVTWQLFPGGCAFTSLLSSASCQLFNTCDPAVPFSLYLSQQEGWSLCRYKYATVLVYQLAKPANSLRSNIWKAIATGFVFSNTLPRHFLWVLHCFGIFSTISEMVFKADILSTCTIPALSISSAAPIAYQIWVLEAISLVKHKRLVRLS